VVDKLWNDLTRWTWRDLLALLGRQALEEPAPPAEVPRITNLARLRRDAAAQGIRVLDLRGLDRRKLYRAHHRCIVRDGVTMSVKPSEVLETDEDFGAWGYFRKKVKGKWVTIETPPVRGRNRGRRKWRKQTTTVIHSTDTAPISAARFIGIPTQGGIAGDATIVLMHGIDTVCIHAHAANSFADGLEIAGRRFISDLQTIAARLYLRYVDAEKRDHGVVTRYVIPHAFSSETRRVDPDRLIWAAVGEWAIATLGWTLGPIVGTARKHRQVRWVKGNPSS
jgi:hypothetical protein